MVRKMADDGGRAALYRGRGGRFLPARATDLLPLCHEIMSHLMGIYRLRASPTSGLGAGQRWKNEATNPEFYRQQHGRRFMELEFLSGEQNGRHAHPYGFLTTSPNAIVEPTPPLPTSASTPDLVANSVEDVRLALTRPASRHER
jgi:hypothetical protein